MGWRCIREGAANNSARDSLLLSECARRNHAEQERRACENSVKTGARGLCHRTLKPFESISDLHWESLRPGPRNCDSFICHLGPNQRLTCFLGSNYPSAASLLFS